MDKKFEYHNHKTVLIILDGIFHKSLYVLTARATPHRTTA
jgi:hypothetical protein